MRTNSLVSGLALFTTLLLIGAGCLSSSSTARTGSPASTYPSGTPAKTVPTNTGGGGIDDSNLAPGAPVNTYEQDLSSPSQ